MDGLCLERDRAAEARRTIQAMLDNTQEGHFVLRGDGSLVIWTQALLRLVGPAAHPPSPGDPLEALFPRDAEAVRACVAEALRGGAPAELEIRSDHAGARDHRWLSLTLQALGPDWIQGRVEEDARRSPPATPQGGLPGEPPGPLDRLGAEREIQAHLADDLTGLTLFLLALEGAQAGFQGAARRLGAHVGGSERMADLGGGEFLLILPALEDPRQALARAEALAAALATPDEAGPALAPRIGIAVQTPEEEPSRSALMQRAGQALARARQGEPGTCCL